MWNPKLKSNISLYITSLVMLKSLYGRNSGIKTKSCDSKSHTKLNATPHTIIFLSIIYNTRK